MLEQGALKIGCEADPTAHLLDVQGRQRSVKGLLIPVDPKELIPTIQDDDQTSINYISHDITECNWVAPDSPLRVPETNLVLLDSGSFCSGSRGKTHTH